MLAAAKYIGAGLIFFNKSIKEMEKIILFSSFYVSTFIFYVFYVMSLWFCLIEILDLLLTISSEFLEIETNTLYETFCFNYMLCQFSSGLMVSSEPGKMKLKRLTKLEQSEYVIPEKLKEILVGLILGDLWTQKRGANTRLRFLQGVCHKDYISHLYELFQDFCPQSPKSTISVQHKKTGNVYETILFYTYSLPCFTEFCIPFYSSGIKIIPDNIEDLLTPWGLAYLISDDGGFCKKKRRITLATNCFSLEEVQLLAQTLRVKFKLICHINKHGNGHVIRISSKSLTVIQELLKDKIPSMMLYKIGL